MFLNLFLNPVVQASARRAVNDQFHDAGLQLQRVHHLGDARGGLYAPAGAVADQQQGIDVGQRAPGDVLEAGLVVDHHVFVATVVLVNLGLQYPVDIAIAALALGATHDQHVIVVLLDQGFIELVFGVLLLGHALGYGTDGQELCVGHLLADAAQRGIHVDAEHLVQVGVGVGVHHQKGALTPPAEALDDHAAGGRLADAPLAGHSDDMC